MNSHATLIILYLLTLLSCRKSTAELPEANLSPTVIELSVKHNNLEKFKLIFREQRTSTYDSVRVFLRNTSGQKLEDVRLLIEVCSGQLGGFDDCKLQPEISIPLIQSDTGEIQIHTFLNDAASLGGSRITVGLISLKGDMHPLAGVYSSITSYVEFFAAGAYQNTAFARGYVFSDGRSTIHIKTVDSAYDVQGLFDIRNNFSGMLTKRNSAPETTVSLVPTKIDSALVPVSSTQQGIHFGLRLRRPLPNAVDSFFLQLNK